MVTRVETLGFWEIAVQPVIAHLLALLFDPVKVNSPAYPRAVGVFGPFLLFRRAAYEALGGHAAVRAQIVEDLRLAEAVKAAGLRLVVARGIGLASLRVYDSLSAIVRGWSKNAFIKRTKSNWQTVPPTQPGVPMTFPYSSESDPGPYPFPANARIEGSAGPGGDMHVLVIETGTCTLYETYSSTYTNPGWSCGSGAKFDLTSNALRPDGWTSADVAGLPILPGLVRVAEVQAGAINHALRFTVSSTQQGYIHPATHAAGSSNTSLPPMGLRVRLKASFDLSGFTGPASVILTAMKQYGLILADNGSNWYVTGDSDDAWSPLMSAINQAFGQVHGSDLEAVETGRFSKPQNDPSRTAPADTLGPIAIRTELVGHRRADVRLYFERGRTQN